MNKEELKKYIENKIEENKEGVDKIMLRYSKIGNLSTALAERGLCEGSIKAYGDIIEKLSNDECNKKPKEEKKYYIKGKFYLKNGAVVEDYCSPNGIDKNIYDTEEEALDGIQYIYELVMDKKLNNKLFIVSKHAIFTDNLLYFSLEPEEVCL